MAQMVKTLAAKTDNFTPWDPHGRRTLLSEHRVCTGALAHVHTLVHTQIINT